MILPLVIYLQAPNNHVGGSVAELEVTHTSAFRSWTEINPFWVNAVITITDTERRDLPHTLKPSGLINNAIIADQVLTWTSRKGQVDCLLFYQVKVIPVSCGRYCLKKSGKADPHKKKREALYMWNSWQWVSVCLSAPWQLLVLRYVVFMLLSHAVLYISEPTLNEK